MKKTLLLLVLLLLNSYQLLAQNCGTLPPADNQVYPWCYKVNEGTNWNTTQYGAYIINGMPFRLLFPKNFDSTSLSTKRYPLAILLHGIGESGSDNNLQLKYGGKNHLDAVNNGAFDGFVMVPQSPQSLWGSAQRAAILSFIDIAVRDLQVDQFRVHLQGYSGGGTTAWKLAYDNPKVFASTIPMSSANGSTATSYAQVLKYTAVWHAQGGRDTRPAPSAGNTVATAFRNAGANYTYQYYHELGHGTWGAMYNEADFFPFLMRNSILRIHALFFKYNFCEGETVSGTMGVQPGFEGYEWRKNGSLVAGATTHELSFNGEGNYTVRIKHKGIWSQWSAPQTIQRIPPTPTPEVIATGPTALPTLDGRTTVTLRAPNGYQNYKWSTNATTDSLLVTRAGTYTVSVTAKHGCPSALSAPIKVTYNINNALPAPTNLVIATTSETVLQLNWTDNSTIETGFEVYRRTSPDGTWTLAGQLPANSTSFSDKGLQHFTRYYYSVRAVNQNGGSGYLSGSGKTSTDQVAPNAPAQLEVMSTSRSSVGLKWLSPEDNNESNHGLTYEIYSNNGTQLMAGTSQNSIILKDLAEKQYYNFTVRAVDAAGNKSPLSNQVTAGTFINGLNYTYHEGELSTVYDISRLPVIKKGNVANFDIHSNRNISDNYAFIFEGYINVPTTGSYTFFTTSDDGSTLSINGIEVVNNNGRHARQERSGTIQLTAGIHAIKVLYFEAIGNVETLEVRWQGPGITKQLISEAALRDAANQPNPPASPGNVTATSSGQQSIVLQWSDNSGNESGFEVHRSSSNAGVYAVVKTLPANTRQFTDAGLAPGTTYYYKLRAIGTTGESAFAGLGAGGIWVNATTTGVSATPAIPTALVAYRSSATSAQLAWEDKALNETGYEVWRATDGVNFTHLLTTGPNIATHSDAAISSSNSFQYRVRAIGAASNSGWSNTAALSTANKPPVINGLAAVISAPAGTTTEIGFNLSDPEGASLLLISRYLPSFARIEKVSSTRGILILTPDIKDIGFYSGIQLTASDSVLETDITISISIKDSEKKSVYVNVGNASIAAKPWNNTNTFAGVANKLVLSNMRDENGELTGYSMTLIDAWTGNKAYGETSGNDTGIYPDIVTRSAYVVGPGKTVRYKISGLKADLRYNFVFFGSSIYKSNNGSTRYTIGTESVSLAVQSNISKTVQINGIKADANGEVIISVAGASDATKGGYLNAFVIEQYPYASPILRPGRFTAHAVSRSQIDLNWTDNSHQETGFEIWRRTLPSGTFSKVATTAAKATGFSDTGLATGTGYEYKIRAVNGGSFSSYSESVQTSTLLYQVYVNANFTLNQGAPWNNLDRRPTTGTAWYNFRNDEASNTGMHLRLEESFDGNNAFGPVANGQGVYPDNVIKTFYFNEIGIVAKMQVFGLNDDYTYNFRFFASSAFSGGENGVSEYRIGNKKVTLDVQNNLKNTAVIRDVQPINGSITIEVEAGEFARYGYLNAMVLEVRDRSNEVSSASSSTFAKATAATATTLATEELIADEPVTAYPNPSQGELFVDIVYKTEGKCKLQVLDMAGRVLQTTEVNTTAGKNTLQLDLRSPAIGKGMFLLKIESAEQQTKIIRFIKQ